MSGIKLVRYHIWQRVDNGYHSEVRCAFVKAGYKWLHVVCIDATHNGGLRRWRVPKSEEAYMEPLMRKGKPYPPKRAVKIFRQAAKIHGITKAAKKILKEVL